MKQKELNVMYNFQHIDFPVTRRRLFAKAYQAMAFLLLSIFIGVETFAQGIPFVYTVENTGAGCPAPVLPSFSQLPTVNLLTDPFAWSNGSGRSTSFNDWSCRRAEIKAEIENYEIGPKPNRPQNITASYSGGTLTVTVTVNGQTLTLTSSVSLPAGPGPFPAVIGMNSLNGSIPADIFTSRNIARITFSHNQVTTYPTPQITDAYFRLYPDRNLDNTGQYSAWAWGVSRIIDGLELVQSSLPINLSRLAVTGCSYAGKMALFAGALDERIALTIAQESGGGGAPAWRVSETLTDVEKLGATSNHWFKNDMFQFAGANVSKLPHDHHELMAMVAPRALLVTGNTDFGWLANPSGYVSARAAHEVYKTFGIGDRFGFYIDGGHGHCAVPTSQRPAMEAFVDKFLLGNAAVNTNITTNPYPSVDHASWYSWWGGQTNPPGDEVWLEAECGTVGSLWSTSASTSASNGQYVTIQAGNNSTASAPANTSGYITYNFSISTASVYTLWARVIAPNGNDDSFWIRMDGGSWLNWNNIAPGSTSWTWDDVTTYNLSAGNHTLTIAYREDGAQLDKLYLASSGSPSGAGSLASNCGGSNPSNYYQLQNRATGLLLDGMGRTVNGDPCGQYANTTHVNSHWELIDVGGGYNQLRNRGTGLVLDGMGRTTNGSDCGQYANTTHVNSHWLLQLFDGSYYQLQNRGTGLFLDGMGRTTNGAACGQWANTTHPNAQWQLIGVSGASVSRLGIKEDSWETNTILFHPNPSNETLTLKMKGGSADVRILNASGQVMIRAAAVRPDSEIDVSGLSEGIYFLEIITSSGVTRSKLIKK